MGDRISLFRIANPICNVWDISDYILCCKALALYLFSIVVAVPHLSSNDPFPMRDFNGLSHFHANYYNGILQVLVCANAYRTGLYQKLFFSQYHRCIRKATIKAHNQWVRNLTIMMIGYSMNHCTSAMLITSLIKMPSCSRLC